MSSFTDTFHLCYTATAYPCTSFSLNPQTQCAARIIICQVIGQQNQCLVIIDGTELSVAVAEQYINLAQTARVSFTETIMLSVFDLVWGGYRTENKACSMNRDILTRDNLLHRARA